MGTSICANRDLSVFETVTTASRHLHHMREDENQFPIFNNVLWDIRQKAELSSNFDVIIHAATPASAFLNSDNPNEMFDVIVQGMKNVIDFASRKYDGLMFILRTQDDARKASYVISQVLKLKYYK